MCLVKLPEGSWIDPDSVNKILLDGKYVRIEFKRENEPLHINPAECTYKSDQDLTREQLRDKVADVINQQLRMTYPH
jgi:hypothetical protein